MHEAEELYELNRATRNLVGCACIFAVAFSSAIWQLARDRSPRAQRSCDRTSPLHYEVQRRYGRAIFFRLEDPCSSLDGEETHFGSDCFDTLSPSLSSNVGIHPRLLLLMVTK